MLFAVLVPNPHPFAFDNDPWLAGFKRLVLNEVMPNMISVCIDNF